jgi:flagellar biosynthetic protein FlhB
MAEDSFQDKTEEATPKHKREARQAGNVPKSAEFNSAFILLFGLSTLYFVGGTILEKLIRGFQLFYQEVGSMRVDIMSVRHYAEIGFHALIGIVLPIATVLAIVGVVINVTQVGFLFTLKTITPKFSKLNPISGLKKFASPKSLIELAKGIIKIVIVSLIAYPAVMEHQDEYMALIYADIEEILRFVASVVFSVMMRTTVVLIIFALFDLLYQRWQFKRDMRMTKQQVKDEARQAEGDPLVKGQIRSMQLLRARERMMEKVPQADVVVTNPVRLAIALKYAPDKMNAPVVLAKGARLIAKRIRELALEHDIPIYENKPLARSLYKLAKVGKEIPYELFHAVAEVFAYVYQLKNRKK